jgi:hypothetical protein
VSTGWSLQMPVRIPMVVGAHYAELRARETPVDKRYRSGESPHPSSWQINLCRGNICDNEFIITSCADTAIRG